MAVEVDHLIIVCNILADAQIDQITDPSAILARIRLEADPKSAAELFQRAAALNSTLGSDGVAQLLGIADGDTIPHMVFDVASRVPMQQGRGPGSDTPCEFDRDTFVASLRAKSH